MIPHLSESWLKSDLVDRRKVWPSCRCKKLLECLLPLHKQPVTGVFGENAEAQKENTDGSATLKRTAPMQWCICASLHCYTTTIKSQDKLKKYSKAPLQWCRYDITAITATKLTLLFQKKQLSFQTFLRKWKKNQISCASLTLVVTCSYYLKVSKNINN